MSDIATYSDLLQMSQRMLSHAREGEWDELVALETLRAEAIARLQAAEHGQLPRQAAAEEKILIRGILSCDDEIRHLAEQWMAESKEILASVNAARKLQQTYR